jgi:hypothetical protein
MLDVIFVVALVMALARAWRARFTVGIVAGVLRMGLVFASFWFIGFGLVSSGAGLGRAPLALAIFAAGPLVSFVTTFLAWHRRRDIPYALEEAADRLFMPWLAVALVDTVSVAIGLFIVVLAAS